MYAKGKGVPKDDSKVGAGPRRAATLHAGDLPGRGDESALPPDDFRAGGSEFLMRKAVDRAKLERRIQELPEAERKALNRRAQSRLGLRPPSRLPDRGRDWRSRRCARTLAAVYRETRAAGSTGCRRSFVDGGGGFDAP